jgi:hypothetical protein
LGVTVEHENSMRVSSAILHARVERMNAVHVVHKLHKKTVISHTIRMKSKSDENQWKLCIIAQKYFMKLFMNLFMKFKEAFHGFRKET